MPLDLNANCHTYEKAMEVMQKAPKLVVQERMSQGKKK